MPADSVIGLLRVVLSAQTAEFDQAMKSSTDKVETFSRTANKFSGTALFKQADQYAASVQKLGGIAKLTATEQSTLNRTLGDAVAKYTALGKDVPPHIAALHAQTKLAAGGTTQMAAATKGLGGALGGMLPLLGVGALVGFAKGAIDTAGAVADMSAKLGVSTTTVQRWQFATSQTGASIDDVSTAINRMSKLASEGGKAGEDAFGKVGLKLDQIKGLNPQQLFETTAAAIGKVKDPTDRTAAALELMGRSGTTLLPAIAEGFDVLGDKAEATGQVMSEDVVRASDALGDSWSSLLGSGQTLIVSVLSPLAPLLTSIAEGLAWVAGNVSALASRIAEITSSGWAEITRDWATALELVGLKAADALPAVQGLAAVKPATADPLKPLTDGLTNQDAIIAQLNRTLSDNNKARDESIRKTKEAEAAADKLNAAQDKQLETMRSAGIMTQDVVATSLAPLVEKLNLAAQVGDTQLRATLLKLTPAFLELRAAIVAAGGSTDALDGILDAFNQRAGLTVGALEALERAIPIQPMTDALGTFQAYSAEAEIAAAQTELTTAAFETFGLKAPAELRKLAEAARIHYETVRNTAGVTAEQVAEAWRQMTDAQLAVQGRIPTAWEAEIVPAIQGATQAIVDTVAGSFASMLTHATSFKDGFVNIWKSIQQAITDILGSILKFFLDRFLKGILAAMTGAKGGFAGAFANLFGGGPGGGGGLLALLGLGGLGAAGGGLPTVATGGTFGGLVPGGTAAGAGGVGSVGAAAGGAAIGGLVGWQVGSRTGNTWGGAGAGAGAGAAGGAAIGAIGGPVGIAAGAIVGAIVGGISGWIGAKTAQKRANDVRDAFTGQFGVGGTGADSGFMRLAAELTEATGEAGGGRLFKRFIEANDPEAVKKAIAAINAELEKYRAKQDEAKAATDERIDAEKAKYSELKAHIQTEMKALDDELKAIEESEAPEEVMGVEESRARARIAERQAQLQAELAVAQEQEKLALEAITAAAGTEFDNIDDRARALADGIEDHFRGIDIPEISIPYRFDAQNALPGPGGVPGYQHGTPSLGFMDFGAGRLVALHGREAVVPESQAGAFAARHGGTAVAITIQAFDGADVARVVNSPAFTSALARRLPFMLTDNLESSRTHTRRALGVD
jgi:hypothetical protein